MFEIESQHYKGQFYTLVDDEGETYFRRDGSPTLA